MLTDTDYKEVEDIFAKLSEDQKWCLYNMLHKEQSRDNIKFFFSEYGPSDASRLELLAKEHNVSKERIIEILTNDLDSYRMEQEYEEWTSEIAYDIKFRLAEML